MKIPSSNWQRPSVSDWKHFIFLFFKWVICYDFVITFPLHESTIMLGTTSPPAGCVKCCRKPCSFFASHAESYFCPTSCSGERNSSLLKLGLIQRPKTRSSERVAFGDEQLVIHNGLRGKTISFHFAFLLFTSAEVHAATCSRGLFTFDAAL